MKKIVHNFLIVDTICLVVLGSCNERNKYDDGVYHLDIRSALSQEPKVFNLSDIGSGGISYIPLETNESSLLSHINKIILSNDHIFITDGMNLFQFGLSGNFVRQIGRAGKGPGEYGRRITFVIDDDQQEILIYSSNVMNVYDLESGSYKRRFIINQDVSGFTMFPHGNLVVFTHEIPSGVLISSINEVFLVNSDGSITDSIPNYHRLNTKSNSRGYASTYEYEKNEIRYLFNYRDTLYRITEDFERIPHVVFNMKNRISRDNGNDGYSEEFEALVKDLNENDNPVLVIIE